MKINILTISVLLIATITLSGAMAETDMEQYNIMVILDASSHMNAKWGGKTRFELARDAMIAGMDEMNKSPSWGLNLAFRIFGDQNDRSKNDCVDYRSAVKLEWFESTLVTRVMEGIQPKGRNCISNALGSVQEDLAIAKQTKHNYVLCLVSSRDECTKDEKVTMDWLTGKMGVAGIYFIGVNVSDADAEYFSQICADKPYRFVNATSPEMLPLLITQYLMYSCQGKEIPAEASGTDAGVTAESATENPKSAKQ